jgi:hypothetical protein
VDPRAILDAVVKRKIPSPCRELNPRTLIIQPIAQLQEQARNIEMGLSRYFSEYVLHSAWG